MKIEILKNCIATLKKLRDEHHSQLDAGALAELDDVLQQLTRLTETEGKDVSLGGLAVRAIQIIDSVISVVTNVTDLMR